MGGKQLLQYIEVYGLHQMMVEAGGTEATWRLYEEGAPKITEDLLAEGLEWCKQWINASIDLQLQLVHQVQEASGPIETIDYEPRFDYDSDVFDAVGDAGTVTSWRWASVASTAS